MSLLSRFEQACAALIERAFARGFPSDLAPAHVARKLVAVMETHTRGEGGRLVAPASYVILTHPDDFARLASERAYLEREWAQLLRDLAARVGVAFSGGEPRVEMAALEDVPPGTVRIELGTNLPRYQLHVIRGVPIDALYRLEGEMVVGRASSARVELVDPSVSRRHASISIVNGVPVVRDLGSRNGTFVNGERIRSCTLKNGDVLTFGNTELRVEGAA